MPEILAIDTAELEAFRMGLPEIDRNEIRNDGIPWDIVKARYLAYRANRQPVEADTDTCWKNIRWISDISTSIHCKMLKRPDKLVENHLRP